jgi:hypothetical protein
MITKKFLKSLTFSIYYVKHKSTRLEVESNLGRMMTELWGNGGRRPTPVMYVAARNRMRERENREKKERKERGGRKDHAA